MRTTLKVTFLYLVVFFTACTPSQKIIYDVSRYQPASEQVNASLSIQTFQDIRQEFSDNQFQLEAKSPTNTVAIFDSNGSCINAEKLYKVPVGQQMATMLNKHLNRKAYFTDVLTNQKELTDYHVTANVKYFIGYQKFSTKAAVGAQFGLIGALATMNLKTEGKIIIELSDICLYDKAEILIAEIGDFKKEYDGDFPVDANCYCIYRNINEALSEFNEELGAILFQEIKKSN